MRDPVTNDATNDAAQDAPGDAAQTIGLRALVWTLAEPERALRLLAVTGLDPRDLRRRTGDPAVLAACLAFLEGHEPDLVACADALVQE